MGEKSKTFFRTDPIHGGLIWVLILTRQKEWNKKGVYNIISSKVFEDNLGHSCWSCSDSSRMATSRNTSQKTPDTVESWAENIEDLF